MKILLATDGSRFSQDAAQLVMRLPWPASRDLTVLSVSENRQQHDPQQLEALEREVERFAADGWAPQTLARRGQAAHEIVSAAAALGADVIAMGSRGRGGVKRFLLGSVSEQVMTYAPCSVLIARQPDDQGGDAASDAPLRILLAYDGSPVALAAMEQLASLALDARAHITVTTVLTLMTYYRMDVLQTTSPSWQAEKQAAQDDLDRVAQRLRSATPNIETQLLESGDASQSILDAAQAVAADLIVAGHKGRSGIERLLLGSVASRVAQHAPCSVWVARG